jgi:hypothetical protein
MEQRHRFLMYTRVLILGCGDLALGFVLLIGSPLRTSSPSFERIKQYAPIRVWAIALLIIGIGLLVTAALRPALLPASHARLEFLLATLGAMWGSFWFVALTQSAIEDQQVALTGPVAYSFFFTLPHLMLAFGREG